MSSNPFADLEYEVGDMPFARFYSTEMRCPFCGAMKVILGYDDLSADTGRVDLYCDNEFCEVRTFTILARHIGRHNNRADVIALDEIDAGVGDERLPKSVNITDPDDSAKIDAHSAGILGRRTREAQIIVVPGSRYPA